MNINDLKTSRFITKNDLPASPHGAEATIQDVRMENAAPPEQKPDMKATVYFAEFNKPFVLNITNATTVASLMGSEETDDWKGGKIELYYDPNIMMGPFVQRAIMCKLIQHVLTLTLMMIFRYE